jgi:hypothetical protein
MWLACLAATTPYISPSFLLTFFFDVQSTAINGNQAFFIK